MSQSLQFRLSAWLALVILLVALATGVISFLSAFQEAIELQDDQLRQAAALIRRQGLQIAPPELPGEAADVDPEERLVVQLLRKPDSPGHEAAGELPGLPLDLPDGLQTVSVQNLSWRVFVKTMASGERVAVGQQTAVRDEIAGDSALRTILSFLVLIPILLLLVGYLIRKMFSPLKKLAFELDQRSEDDLREISAKRIPSEISPFVVAINRLLSQVASSVAVQRRFVSDAAHELRSPLTVLSLQAERLEAAEMSAQAKEQLNALGNAIKRTRALIEQLLSMARVQETSREITRQVSVQSVFRQVLEDLLPLAEAKRIDIGVVGEGDIEITIREADLNTLIKNLVENAIRYTPEGGHVDLSVQTVAGRVILRIEDTGPGIPETERERVFDPFYRVLGTDVMGSGLGLSIVRTIAERIGATINLAYADRQNRSGLQVTVTLPSKSR